MKRHRQNLVIGCALAIGAFSAGQFLAAQVDVGAGPVKVQVGDREKSESGRAYRASKVIGMTVRNDTGKAVAEVNDLVVDSDTGKVRYAALELGGFLGVGEKLFAVPWTAMSVRQDENGNQFVLINISEDKLKQAPGFDSDKWPDMADRQWMEGIDKYYGVEVDTSTQTNR
jgi:sporulation protein YlmC with PRC-barrel domain